MKLFNHFIDHLDHSAFGLNGFSDMCIADVQFISQDTLSIHLL